MARTHNRRELEDDSQKTGKWFEDEFINRIPVYYNPLNFTGDAPEAREQDEHKGTDGMITRGQIQYRIDPTLTFLTKDNTQHIGERAFNSDAFSINVQYGIRTGNKHGPFEEPVLVVGIQDYQNTLANQYSARGEEAWRQLSKKIPDILDYGTDLFESEKQIDRIIAEPFSIGQIPRQTEILQQAALANASPDMVPMLYRTFNAPTSKVDLLAAKKNGMAIEYMSDPKEDIQLAAIIENPEAYSVIQSPAPAITAFMHDIEHYPDASRAELRAITDEQRAKLKDNPLYIGKMQPQTSRLQELAINLASKDIVPAVAQQFRRPSMYVMEKAVKENGFALEAFRNVTGPDFEKLAETAVKTTPAAIQLIDAPSEKLQLLAVKTDPKSIQYINNPTDKVKGEAVSRDTSLASIIHGGEDEALIQRARKTDRAKLLQLSKDVFAPNLMPEKRQEINKEIADLLQKNPTDIGVLPNPSKQQIETAIKAASYAQLEKILEMSLKMQTATKDLLQKRMEETKEKGQAL